MSSSSSTIAGRGLRLLAALACGLTLLWAALTGSAHAQTTGPTTGQPGDGSSLDSASLAQCLTASEAAERSITFVAEMTTIPGATRMEMRIDFKERMSGEALFHTVAAPGLGVWRGSDPGVKIYKYVKQVTDLAAPALYRAVVRFHWLNANGHLLKRTALLTATCQQPAPPVATLALPSSPLE